MKTHNKILLAGELLVDAEKTYRSGETDGEFAKSILLAGAVIGIVAPLLEEQKIKSSHVQLAEMAARLRGLDVTNLPPKKRGREIGRSIGFYRLVYNSLKHAGDREKVKPSQDLLFDANLKEEAGHLISSAIDDYNKLSLLRRETNLELSDNLLTLLQSGWVA
ncbi:hypothetical protein E4T66_20150 [Sinimarinibacterium sp. CAU 1509]|uniref:hypothetical protein n=1 Tax=Sinimarinibacterium sp. CAU 1509 TaxID=2562283 RepID=UPI0010AC20A6|nr:hypothetical protein [Sinimarinibacterium sp. CAU 1509]TJY55903.1 hypothetical protein E4T66_20150 [Sinimarinibacterium sp. CAU 1509]